jgi:hypothetical protein
MQSFVLPLVITSKTVNARSLAGYYLLRAFASSILFLIPGLLAAQEWTAPIRGSWIQSGTPTARAVVLCGPGQNCEIVVSGREGSAVQQAAFFLASDIEKISGVRPKLVSSPNPGVVAIRLITVGNEDIPAEVDAASLKGEWESYRISTIGSTVWLVGADANGTAYAAYTLSERLGVDPLYIWTGYQPEHHFPLVLKETKFRANPPTFRYRGCFHDDEDILPRPFDEKGYPKLDGDVPLEWYNRYFETALRLRMNMVVPYTRVHRRKEVQELASKWGLFYTGQHYDVLVSNPFGFRRFKLAEARGVKPIWNWFTNRDGMIKYWQAGIDENRHLNVIWPLGMRGLSDEAFVFPDGMSDAEKAKVFRDVIRTQVEMVARSLPPDRTPVFTFTMYGEMFNYYTKYANDFDLPSNVTVIWIDNNDGVMNALPQELGRWKHGVYYHLAYWWGPVTKQETHTVTPTRIAEEFSKVLKAGATEYMLVNVSEMRDYVMDLRMLSDITWNGPEVLAHADPGGQFVSWWSREYFGDGEAGNGDPPQKCYQRYFDLLDSPDKLWFGSDCVEALLGRLYKRIESDSFPEFPNATLTELRERVRRQNDAFALLSAAKRNLSLSQQRFFGVDVELGLQIDHRHCQAAIKLNDALYASTREQMWAAVFEARAALEQLEIELSRSEYPPFDRWYQETWLRDKTFVTNPHRPFNELRAFIGNEGRGKLDRSRQPWERQQD